MALVNNFFEIRSDAYKMTVHFRRPIPMRTDTIGAWLDMLTFLTWLAALVNSSLVYLFSPAFSAATSREGNGANTGTIPPLPAVLIAYGRWLFHYRSSDYGAQRKLHRPNGTRVDAHVTDSIGRFTWVHPCPCSCSACCRAGVVEGTERSETQGTGGEGGQREILERAQWCSEEGGEPVDGLVVEPRESGESSKPSEPEGTRGRERSRELVRGGSGKRIGGCFEWVLGP